MTELQQARADWLRAESKVVKLESENSELRQQVFELRMNLMVSQVRAITAESMATASMQALLVA